jgi:hypothetical protein
MNPGTYQARATRMVIEQKSSGALMVNMLFTTENNEQVRGSQCLVQKDGTISTITLDTLKSAFGWDGLDPFWLTEEANTADKIVEIAVDWEQYKNSKGETVSTLKVKYINAPGQAGALGTPADRNAVLAKYGAKFRALSGGKSVTKPAPAPPKDPGLPGMPPPPPTAPKPPPAPACTMEEAWATLCESMEGQDRAAMEAKWNETLAKLGKPTDQFTGQDWHTVKAGFEDNIAY